MREPLPLTGSRPEVVDEVTDILDQLVDYYKWHTMDFILRMTARLREPKQIQIMLNRTLR